MTKVYINDNHVCNGFKLSDLEQGDVFQFMETPELLMMGVDYHDKKFITKLNDGRVFHMDDLGDRYVIKILQITIQLGDNND